MMIRTDVASLEHPLAATNAEPRAGTAARARPDVVGRAARLRSLSVPARVAYGVTCLYAAVFTFFAVARHLAFLSQRDDLGNMTQAIWATLHGHPLSTTTEAGNQLSRLGIHVDPFLLLLTPLWWLWSNPLMLVTLQALAVTAGAFP